MLIPWLALHWTVAVIRALASLPFASASVQLSAAGLVGYFALLGTGMLAVPTIPAACRPQPEPPGQRT